MNGIAGGKRLGVIGGLGAAAGADVYRRMTQSVALGGLAGEYEVLFEQDIFEDEEKTGAEKPNLNGRKLYIYDMMQRFERRGADRVLLPCFVSHTFIQELQAELTLPIVNIMQALRTHLDQRVSGPCKVGILASNYVKDRKLFERHFDPQQYTLLYPSDALQRGCVMPALYGPQGLKTAKARGLAIELLRRACLDLLAQGADVIVPGASEIGMVVDALRDAGLPVVDTNQVYVDHALAHDQHQSAPAFKIGIIGGVGPAATVDFMDKIIRNTAARRDQDHIRLIVEHNPKIPDRTANLIADGDDPTLALYSACKRLEANDAALIAIPCNTAHAYVERIQSHLSIPIVNMLFETVSYIRQRHFDCAVVGLLATDGTIASRVYHEVAAGCAFDLIVPDAIHQDKVMSAIYGERGVKAGHVEGECREQLLLALAHLVERGASVVILGCTELPLVLAQDPDFAIAGQRVAILDPTDILARRCVALAQA